MKVDWRPRLASSKSPLASLASLADATRGADGVDDLYFCHFESQFIPI